MAVISANVDEELVEWADRHHAALGYRSRSALINDVLAEKREEVESEEGDA